MATVDQFKDLAQRYGFRTTQHRDVVSLCVENTDGDLTPWVKYNSRKEEVSLCGETDYLNI